MLGGKEMNTNEKFKEYEIGILELTAEIFEKEGYTVVYKTSVNDFLSPYYALYKHYERPNRRMSDDELEDYIVKNYLYNYVVTYKGTIIGKSDPDAIMRQANGEGGVEDVEFEKPIASTTEEWLGELGLSTLKEVFENKNTKKNEFEVDFTVANHWEDIKPGELYKSFDVYDYLYNDEVFKQITISMYKVDAIQAPITDYDYDIEVTAYVKSKEAQTHFNIRPGKAAQSNLFTSKKVFENCEFGYAVQTLTNSLLDGMYHKYGGKNR